MVAARDSDDAIQMRFGRFQRRVRRVVGQEQEERLLLMGLDECDGFAGEGVGQVILLDDRLGAAHDAIGPRTELGQEASGIRFGIHVIVGAVEKAEELLKAAGLRNPLGIAPQVPLADEPGGVARGIATRWPGWSPSAAIRTPPWDRAGD